jgi:hypothetical protein
MMNLSQSKRLEARMQLLDPNDVAMISYTEHRLHSSKVVSALSLRAHSKHVNEFCPNRPMSCAGLC